MLRSKSGANISCGRAPAPGAEQIACMAEHAPLRREGFYVYYQKN